MTDERFELLTEKYLEGRLTDDEARELVEAPAEYRARLYAEVTMAGLLQRAEGEAPADLAAKVTAALRTQAEKQAMLAAVMGRITSASRRRWMFRGIIGLAAAALFAVALYAVLRPEPPAPAPLPAPAPAATLPVRETPPLLLAADTRRAVDRAVEYLHKAKLPPATHQAPMAADELILLSFLHAGVSPEDAMFQKLLAQILATKMQRTYCVSLQAVALQKLDPVQYQARIAECAQFLVDNQCVNGQWSYGTPVVMPVNIGAAVKKTREGPLSGNNSCSNFAAMGLRACVDAGIKIPIETFYRASRFWIESQRVDSDGRGGWCYTREENPHRPYGSMSAGGLASLVICDKLSGRDWRKDKAALRAADWVSFHFTPLENYGPVEELMAKEMISDTPNMNTELYYYLWSVERAATLCGMPKFGTHDWYADAAHEMIAAQRADGSWFSGVKRCQPVYDTCYAILFLMRSTRPMGD
jgi:hypothetical protein